MQHIYVIQPLSVVEKSAQTSPVMNSSDDSEDETCQRNKSLQISILHLINYETIITNHYRGFYV